MPQMISIGNELIRINPAKNQIEYSNNNGNTWYSRYSSGSSGRFVDLLAYGNELLAATDKGVYYSPNRGNTWYSRYTSGSCGGFLSLMDGGSELLAQTTNGFYYSPNRGNTWYLRHR